MNGFEQALAGIIVAFLGFQIGSIVEYKKKYNFADLELDIGKQVEQKLLSLFGGAKAEVKKGVEMVDGKL